MIIVHETVKRFKDTDLFKELEKIVKKVKGQYFNGNVLIYQTRGMGSVVRNDTIHVWSAPKNVRSNQPYLRVSLNEAKRLGFDKADVKIEIEVLSYIFH